ncbi:uncharacterized protein LOC112570355 [Pomacea canaliculata]|uniref:uncharacterized protein LOC112570355 n=1 Tax=Pomacea canaliculata TaxID=400727 RepID=UPI000D73B1BD|nr:uncharacterized protein LOC112570355 [Pomacea canaliculata]
MLLQQREMLAVSSVVWTLVLTQPDRVCQSGVSSDRISASQALREVIGLLEWLEVTVISNSQIGDANVDIKDLTDDLTAASLAVLVVDVGLSQIAQLDLATLPTHNVVVVGSADFVTGVFHGLRHFQFTTRWITILAKEDLRPFEATVQGFENVLVVANKTTGGAELWTLLREGEKCKFRFLSSLPLTTVRLTPQVIFPNPGLGLGVRQLRIVVMERSFFLFKSKETEAYEGVVMDMLTEIARKLNFSCVLLQSPDGTWGEVNAKKEWTGAIGMLTRNVSRTH